MPICPLFSKQLNCNRPFLNEKYLHEHKLPSQDATKFEHTRSDESTGNADETKAELEEAVSDSEASENNNHKKVAQCIELNPSRLKTELKAEAAANTGKAEDPTASIIDTDSNTRQTVHDKKNSYNQHRIEIPAIYRLNRAVQTRFYWR